MSTTQPVFPYLKFAMETPDQLVKVAQAEQ